MKCKPFIYVIICLIFLISFLNIYPEKKVMAASEKVTKIESQQAAVWNVNKEIYSEKEHCGWYKKSIKIKEPILIYDSLGNQIAYLLNVEGDNKPAGFILVSSFLDEDPIIMWADRGIFNEDTFLDKIKNKQEKLVSKQIV